MLLNIIFKNKSIIPIAMETKYLIAAVILAFIALIALMFFSVRDVDGKNYDDFAQCIIDSGAKMYGAWWCGHCAEQKNDFGSSWDLFKEQDAYVECSTQTRTQTQQCQDEGITGYPTWRFSDGTEQSGRLSFEFLAQKTGCSLP